MVQQLQKGLTMECAQALHRYGLTRDPETPHVMHVVWVSQHNSP